MLEKYCEVKERLVLLAKKKDCSKDYVEKGKFGDRKKRKGGGEVELITEVLIFVVYFFIICCLFVFICFCFIILVYFLRKKVVLELTPPTHPSFLIYRSLLFCIF